MAEWPRLSPVGAIEARNDVAAGASAFLIRFDRDGGPTNGELATLSVLLIIF